VNAWLSREKRGDPDFLFFKAGVNDLPPQMGNPNGPQIEGRYRLIAVRGGSLNQGCALTPGSIIVLGAASA
jgi:hypothetical protein